MDKLNNIVKQMAGVFFVALASCSTLDLSSSQKEMVQSDLGIFSSIDKSGVDMKRVQKIQLILVRRDESKGNQDYAKYVLKSVEIMDLEGNVFSRSASSGIGLAGKKEMYPIEEGDEYIVISM